MERHIRKKNLENRLFMRFLLFSVVPVLVLGMLTLAYIFWNLMITTGDSSLRSIEYACSKFENLAQQAYQTGKSLSIDSRIIYELLETDSPENSYSREVKINAWLQDVDAYLPDAIDIYILSNYGDVYRSTEYTTTEEAFLQSGWYRRIAEGRGARWFLPYSNSRIVASPRGTYIAVGMPIEDLADGQNLGAVYIEICIDDILERFNRNDGFLGILCMNSHLMQTGERIDLFEKDTLIDLSDGGLRVYPERSEYPKRVYEGISSLSYWNSDFAASGIQKEKNNTLVYCKIDLCGWVFVQMVPVLQFYKLLLIVIVVSLCALLLAINAAVFMSKRISHSFTQPLRTLTRHVRMIGKNDMNVTVPSFQDDEIGELGKQFNNMIGRIQELVNRVAQEESEKQKMQMMLLQAQLNPHFLYNTLDSLLWLIRMNNNEDAIFMLSALASFYKTGLNSGNEMITLEHEIENIESYLAIQGLRYRSVLSYEITLDDKIGKIMMPKFVLQPLVENALYHGIKQMSSPGRIVINCELEEDELIIMVSDDGVGMDAETLEKLREKLDYTGVQSHSSYGITSVHERMKLCFGDDYRLLIFSKPHEGTMYQIRIRNVGGHIC